MTVDHPTTFAQWLLRSLATLGDCNGHLHDL
ncbi:hypothetical protein P353_23605 [Comamonas testosteroni]|uniref:Uncharacterized protein n=1 Tax=Comamonas testosteroni TaxID=285 RepID=A0A096GKU1_COMTE|nr:hypothetical protein P353_23605 [Comamonas testosteroni]